MCEQNEGNTFDDVKSFPPIVAVDYDNTLTLRNTYPELGVLDPLVVNSLIAAKRQGCALILWTCRYDKELDPVIAQLSDAGLEFDAVNDDIPAVKERWGNRRSPKVFANIYLDDRALNVRELLMSETHSIDVHCFDDKGGVSG